MKIERHHILEIITTKDGSDGDYGKIILNSVDKLKELGLYGNYRKKNFGLPSWMICECRSDEHKRLHSKFRSEEHKKKMCENHKGFKGKKHNEEAKRKMCESHKGKPSPMMGVTTSLFGMKFKEHFGITRKDDIKLYDRERIFYIRHGYFRWENEQISIAS